MAIFSQAESVILFAGHCSSRNSIRAFMMDMDRNGNFSLKEVLSTVGSYEMFGSGEAAAKALIPSNPTSMDFINVLRAVIDDTAVSSVGGNVQYGDFSKKSFQPAGVAERGSNQQGVHYWRGPLDLNGQDFDQSHGLQPMFPYLNLIGK